MSTKKKRIIEFTLFILLLISIVFVDAYLNKEQSSNENLPLPTSEKNTTKIIEIQNADQFEQEMNNSNRTIFIEFYTTWCNPCKKMLPIIEEMASEYHNITFLRIDKEQFEELAKKYEVSHVPTMFIVKDGKVTKTFVGLTNKEDIVCEF